MTGSVHRSQLRAREHRDCDLLRGDVRPRAGFATAVPVLVRAMRLRVHMEGGGRGRGDCGCSLRRRVCTCIHVHVHVHVRVHVRVCVRVCVHVHLHVHVHVHVHVHAHVHVHVHARTTIVMGPAALERVVAGRYEWRDRAMPSVRGKRKRFWDAVAGLPVRAQRHS